MAIIFGADTTAAFNDIKDVVDFEIEIANVRASYIFLCLFPFILFFAIWIELIIYTNYPC